ncbi:MAG TPA: hypothetical protein VK002_09030 [Rubricoccaceae bacterium]|nr:hypothetical protein [Rubricoccaceae bacterium]
MPDAPAPTPSTATLLLAAVGVGLVVVMLLAVLMPRSGAEEGVSWTVPLLGGLVAAAVTYAVGAMRKGRRTTDVRPPR